MCRLAAVDVGVVNLALAFGTLDTDTRDVAITRTALVDTRAPMCDPATCTLHHTGMATDRVSHVLKVYAADFDAATEVVIERKPPGGLRDVEQVFATLLRHKCFVMAPRTMHAAIGSSGLQYEARKAVSMHTAARFTDLTPYAKRDDVADAVCLLLVRAKQILQTLPPTHAFDFTQYAFTKQPRTCPTKAATKSEADTTTPLPSPAPPPSLLIVRSRYWTSCPPTPPTT